MNTGQMLLVLGALVLLSMVSISINSMIINKTSTMLEAEADLNAVSLAQSMLDEIMKKSYDAATAGGAKVFDSTAFTIATGLGPNASESGLVSLPDSLARTGSTPPSIDSMFRSDKYYNDVDDYNGYKRIAYSTTMGNFNIIDTVLYVTEADPNVKSSTQTFYKKVVVTVRHPNMYPPSVSYGKWDGRYFLQISDVCVYRRYF
jgi:hypothetical protein